MGGEKSKMLPLRESVIFLRLALSLCLISIETKSTTADGPNHLTIDLEVDA